ncbi:MAG: methyltransferase [Chloroflexota bacterium]|nr:methyltransferase [Chloroflexota bacterium]
MRSQKVLQPQQRNHALIRSLARTLLRLRFHLFQRHRHNRVVIEEIAGKPLVVLPGVMNPKLFRTGEKLARALDVRLVPSGSSVLDMGTGTGVVALFAEQWAGRVVAVDINPMAVRCARINVLLNQAEERVAVREGDLFEPVADERFDVVLFNPPFFRGTPHNGFDRAWRAHDVVERFAADLGDHLTPKGHAVVILSTEGDTLAFLRAFQKADFVAEVVRMHNLGNEVLTIYRFQPL